MPKFMIERELPNAGKQSAAEMQAISQKSCGVLREMGPQIQWNLPLRRKGERAG